MRSDRSPTGRPPPRQFHGGAKSMDTRKVLGLVAGFAIVLSACNATASPSSGGTAKGPDGALVKRGDIKIEFVTHGQAIDGFWGVVRNGVKAGAADMGVTVNYNAPGPGKRHARHVGPDRRGRRQEADRPRRLDPEPGRAQPIDLEGCRRRDPGGVDELGLGCLQEARHPRPRRADRAPGGHRRRPAVQGCRREERRVLQPGSRQPGPDPALQRVLPGPRPGRPDQGQGPDRQDLRSGRHAGHDRGGPPGRPDDRRRPDPRAVRRRAGAGRRRGVRPARSTSRPST